MKASKWTSARKKLKAQFEAQGIIRCELCGSGYNLSFAHRLKRRFITTDAELMTVALLCVNPCHTQIEYSGHEQMFTTITEIINNRSRRTEEI